MFAQQQLDYSCYPARLGSLVGHSPRVREQPDLECFNSPMVCHSVVERIGTQKS